MQYAAARPAGPGSTQPGLHILGVRLTDVGEADPLAASAEFVGKPRETNHMTRRVKVWMTVGAAFASLNFLGGLVAAADGEAMHSGIHGALTLVTVLLMWWLVDATRQRREATTTQALPAGIGDRLQHLEQSVDAMAVELERIGEGQRFLTQHLTRSEDPKVSRGAPPSP